MVISVAALVFLSLVSMGFLMVLKSIKGNSKIYIIPIVMQNKNRGQILILFPQGKQLSLAKF